MTVTRAAAPVPSLGGWIETEEREDSVVRVHLQRAPTPGATREATPALAAIVRHLATGREELRGIPIALDVSAFDARVLAAMREIPPGETRSYGDLARAIGLDAGAARAVGGACARNPAIVLVPCHRVVQAGGALGHYSGIGGVATKEWLLRLEGAWPPVPRAQARLPFS